MKFMTSARSSANHDAIGFLEAARSSFRLPPLFDERFRVPFAAFRAEEVASIHVDRPR